MITFFHLCRVVEIEFAHAAFIDEHFDMIVHQLQFVLVSAYHKGVDPVTGCPGRNSAYDIVSFVFRKF